MKGGTLASGRSHAAGEASLRARKAMKIARLLRIDGAGQAPLRILEVGAGSGLIAHWFAARGHAVTAVDVVDERVVADGYEFQRIDGADLPFPAESFDVLISNHVIEHVGDLQAQRQHLQELRRVVRRDGSAYLAMPNRWMLIEPHYGLPFLSWLPDGLADFYVRAMRKGEGYDCRPLTRPQLQAVLKETGWLYLQHHRVALKAVCEIESSAHWSCDLLLRWLPGWTYSLLAPIFPTLIYSLFPCPVVPRERP